MPGVFGRRQPPHGRGRCGDLSKPPRPGIYTVIHYTNIHLFHAPVAGALDHFLPSCTKTFQDRAPAYGSNFDSGGQHYSRTRGCQHPYGSDLFGSGGFACSACYCNWYVGCPGSLQDAARQPPRALHFGQLERHVAVFGYLERRRSGACYR